MIQREDKDTRGYQSPALKRIYNDNKIKILTFPKELIEQCEGNSIRSKVNVRTIIILNRDGITLLENIFS